MPHTQTQQIEEVGGSGIYPATGPYPDGPLPVRTPAEFAHPDERRRINMSVPSFETVAQVVGRTVFGGYFLYNGINHLANHETMTGYARSKGVPAPGAAVAVSGLMLAAGGLSILLGARPKLGAGLIIGFLAGVSPRMHAFWNEQDPQQRMQEMVNFTKNMALVGASLFAAGQAEPWPWQLPAGGEEGLMPLRG